MQITISIHQTPQEVYDALKMPEQEPRNESAVRWKTIDLSDDVSITFFKQSD